MKSYMELCEDCDRLAEYPKTYYKLRIADYSGVFGYLSEDTVQKMPWDEHWKIDHNQRTVQLLGDSADLRSERLSRLLITARDGGIFQALKKWSNEEVPVYGPDRELVLRIERVAAPLLGVVTYAVQLIVYCEDESGISIWAARRSAKKWLYPNKLGVTVAGGLPIDESPFDCVIREAWEEAGLPNELVRRLTKSAGVVKYATETDSKTTGGGEAGLVRAEVQFLYEMKVEADITPAPHDMEASDISLYSVDDIKKALAEGEFTPGNACYILAFFIRHGIVTFENEPRYTEIVTRLQRSLGMYTA